MLDIGTVDDDSLESSNFFINQFKEIDDKKSISDQKINTNNFSMCLNKSITSELSSDDIKNFKSDLKDVYNLGSDEQVSINQMIEIIEEIANIKIEKEYQLDKPLGVRGRSSNNDLVREKLNWDIQIKLKDGLEKTYKWIYDEITSGKNNDKFSKSSY